MNWTEESLRHATEVANKRYSFDDAHDPERIAEWWYQSAPEGRVLFLVFYTQACRWSRCLGCNLPMRMSSRHIPFDHIMAQIDHLFAEPAVRAERETIRKVIVSNNGSVLDEATFSSTALIYLIATLNRLLPNLTTLTLETRPEYVDLPELEFIARALREGATPTTLEIAIGFEAFDPRIRNELFQKGLELRVFEELVQRLAPHGFRLKCYFMLKPVPEMSDAEARADLEAAINYLGTLSKDHGVPINIHLNPTYAAIDTPLETAFRAGTFTPPTLADAAAVARYAKGMGLEIVIGLSDEGLATAGGSFRRPGDEELYTRLEEFNRSQDFELLD